MDSNAIKIAVRPFHPEKEAPFVQTVIPQLTFAGDGAFASPVKPMTGGGIRRVIDVCDDRMLDFDKPEVGHTAPKSRVGGKRYKNRKYIFDHVLGMEATQDEVFQKTAQPLLEGVLTGYNATIFAYGATGCGKTHTIAGTDEDQGIIVRTTAELFRQIEETKDEYDTYIEVSMVEIYNETIRDLLSDDFPACPTGGLRLLENEKNRVTVGGVTLKRPQSVEDIMNLVSMGNGRRQTNFTAMNSQSSRSHAVLQMNVGRTSKGHQIDLEESVVRTCLTSATLSIIDLAGSERAAATQNMGARMKEGANINKSLLALSSCIAALCQRPIRGVKPHVPYRNSKLTRMLKFSLGGNCRTVMIVCVSPSSKDLEDTYNTLLWADKAKNVSTKISQNTAGVDVRTAAYIEALAKKEQELKEVKEIVKKLQQGEKLHQDKRRDYVRSDLRLVLADVEKQVTKASDVIFKGTAYRAAWDGIELMMTAMKARLETVDTPEEKEYLNSLIKHQYTICQSNPAAQEAIRQEQLSQSTIDNVLHNASQRKFGDGADPADIDNLRYAIELHKSSLQRQMLETREKAYREALQKHAIAAVNVATVLHDIVGRLQKQKEQLGKKGPAYQGVVDDLEGLALDGEAALGMLFKKTVATALPPLPTADQLQLSSRAFSPAVKPSPVSAPSALSSVPVYRPAPPMSPLARKAGAMASILDTPSGKRLAAGRREQKLHGRSPAKPSPRRGARFTIKTKGSPFTQLKPVSNERRVGWAAEVEGKYITDSENSKEGIVVGSSDEENWVDEDAPSGSTSSRARSGVLAQPARRISMALPKRTIQISPEKIVAAGQSSSTTTLGAAARIRPRMDLPGSSRRASLAPPKPAPLSTNTTGQSVFDRNATNLPRHAAAAKFKSTLVALDEREGTSSPESGHSRSSSGRKPLDERSSVPGANSSIDGANIAGLPSSSETFNNLFKPTQSSLGKMSGLSKRTSLANIGSGLPSDASSNQRRVSNTGPSRNERTASRGIRNSIAPTAVRSGNPNESTSRFGMGSSLATIVASPRPGFAADSPSPQSSPTAPPVKTYNPLAGGASRLMQPTASSASRRMSMMNIAGTAAAQSYAQTQMSKGPRHSVSMAQIRPMGGPRTSIMPGHGASRLR